MILDASALSAVADNEEAADRLFSQAAHIELSVIVLGEYRFGIAHYDAAMSMKSGLGNSSPQHECWPSTRKPRSITP